MEIKNKIAIGCLVQWYEIELIDEYLISLRNAVREIKNRKNIIVDLCLNINEDLEKLDTSKITMNEISHRFDKMVDDILGNCSYTIFRNEVNIYTIADYRRNFNNQYCTQADILMWVETDSLIPRQTFQILDNLHEGVKDTTPKYVGFFSTCKMWDKSWEILEHPEFTVKPFIENDTKNWLSLKYNMTSDEMNSFNDKVEELDVRTTNQLKFNGCGLVISSELIKSGVNIPKSVFFVHEDTAFMNSCMAQFRGNLPQYIIKNILLVHNRKHPKKRLYVIGEDGIAPGDNGAARKRHDWYVKANQMCEKNAYNLIGQGKSYTWDDVFK